MAVKDYALKMKKAAPIMGTLSSEVRNNAIQEIINTLLNNKQRGKIHARGPVGLEGMITYKYKLCGNGQMVKDYEDGSRFKFKEII